MATAYTTTHATIKPTKGYLGPAAATVSAPPSVTPFQIAQAAYVERLAEVDADPRLYQYSERLTAEQVETAFSVIYSFFPLERLQRGLPTAGMMAFLQQAYTHALDLEAAGQTTDLPFLWMHPDDLDEREAEENMLFSPDYSPDYSPFALIQPVTPISRTEASRAKKASKTTKKAHTNGSSQAHQETTIRPIAPACLDASNRHDAGRVSAAECGTQGEGAGQATRNRGGRKPRPSRRSSTVGSDTAATAQTKPARKTRTTGQISGARR